MAMYFKVLKKAKQVMYLDAALFAVGGLAHVLPDVMAPIVGFALGPVTVQMIAGALMVARAVDLFMK